MSGSDENSKGPTLTGPQRAATLMLAFGEERAAAIMSRLYDDEVRALSSAMTTIGSLTAESVEEMCLAFVNELGRSGVIGGWEATQRLLNRSLPPDRAAQIMQEMRLPAGRTVWDKLANVNETILATYLKNEHPQTVALVLSKIKPDHSARILALLPEELAGPVILRMLRMETPQRAALDHVERTLQSEFMSNLAKATARDTHEVMAEIFNNLDRATEGRMMAQLEELSSEAAGKVRALMFTFEDLQKLDTQAIQILLRTVQADTLTMALKGASGRLRDLFMRGMSERSARILLDDLEALGPVRLRDVESAQVAIVARAKELAAQGEIFLDQSKDEEMIG
jgi:flagellar motor switch protein FliG